MVYRPQLAHDKLLAANEINTIITNRNGLNESLERRWPQLVIC